MPWSVLKFIVGFSLLIMFMGFNLDNTMTISLGFIEFKDVPLIRQRQPEFLT